MNSRTLGSRALILRGVKARESRLRWMSWIGGSSKTRVPGGISMPDFRISSTTPLAELKVW